MHKLNIGIVLKDHRYCSRSNNDDVIVRSCCYKSTGRSMSSTLSSTINYWLKQQKLSLCTLRRHTEYALLSLMGAVSMTTWAFTLWISVTS